MKLTGEDFIRSCDDLRKRISGRRVQTPVAMMPLSLPDLPESWCWTSLSSLCERVSVGHVGPTTEFFCDAPAGIPFIRSQDVRPGKLTLANVAHVVQSFHDKLKKSQLKSGDILIVRVGANRGDCCVVPDGVGSLNCANIVFARPLVPNRFLGFFFNSEFGQSLLGSLTTGSAQGVLNTQSIATIPVPVPPINLQRKIASILSAYDDLIENNTRRIAILEEMAQAIYREWFVNFRFPGHENVKLVDSTLGKVPEGWRAGTLDDCCDFQEGYVNPSQKYPEYFGDEIKWLRAVDLNNSFVFETTRSLSQIGFDSAGKSKLLFEPDTLAISKSGTIGRIGILKDYMCGNRAVINIKPQRNICGNQFIFHTLLVHNREIVQLATGSVQKNLYVSVLGAQKIVIPTPDILREFEQRISPFADGIATNQRKSSTLRATRDLLLPKLISGQLDVEDLDIDVGMTAEELAEAAAG